MAAARPKTLPAAVAPVAMGSALAERDDVFMVTAALAALAGAVFIQIGTNFANDYFDFRKGTDDDERIGPKRATAAGWVAPRTMKRATVIAFGLAMLAGVYLVGLRGWPMAVLGIVSIILGVLYTAGPKPLAYVGLGDLFVLVFFGPIATAGTYFAQAGEFTTASWIAGLAPGLISTALLTVNNLRDIEGDRRSGKRTLAVRLGATFAKSEYVLCIVLASLVPIALHMYFDFPKVMLLAALICVMAVPLMIKVVQSKSGQPLSSPLAGTGALLILFAITFCGACLWT